MTTEQKEQHLMFRVAGESYAVRSAAVREIVELAEMARLASMPFAVRGVMNLRGTVLPIVDLSLQFGFGPSEVTRRSCVMVIDAELDTVRTTLGLLTDEVLDVISLGQSDIEAVPAFGTRVRTPYLAGMTTHDEQFIMLLDADRLLSLEELLAVTAEG